MFPVVNYSATQALWLRVYPAGRSHIRLQSNLRGQAHLITIPDHDNLRIGTLNGILSDVADYLGVDRAKLARDLFEK